MEIRDRRANTRIIGEETKTNGTKITIENIF